MREVVGHHPPRGATADDVKDQIDRRMARTAWRPTAKGERGFRNEFAQDFPLTVVETAWIIWHPKLLPKSWSSVHNKIPEKLFFRQPLRVP